MAVTLNDLGKTLIKQLYQVTTGGDENVKPSKDSFLSWVTPGLAFTPEDFQFCAKGMGGGADAEADKALVQQAFNLANLIDFIPDRSLVYNNDMQQTIWRTSEARLSHMYGEILRFSKVVTQDLSDAEKAKIEKFRKLLRTEKVVKDIITDEEKTVVEDGPILRLYNEKMAAYLTAATNYNNKRIAAQAATGPEGKLAVADWTNNANIYRLQVKSAMDDWTGNGYRNEVDQIRAYINQVTQRDMMLWKQRLLEYYEDAEQAGLGAGQNFKYTTLVPGSFATSRGWNDYNLYHNTVDSSSHGESSSWGGSAGVNFGFFSVGGNAGGSSAKFNSNFAVTKFRLSFQFTQAVISRPWFYPEFFMNRGWTLRKGEGWNYDQMPSDGKMPPGGNLIGYPTTILFVRDVVIESSEFVSAYKEYSSSVGGGASVGWGPFRLSGNYSHSESGREYKSTDDGKSLKIPGMQIIGFVNHMIGQAPNPLPELKPEDFH